MLKTAFTLLPLAFISATAVMAQSTASTTMDQANMDHTTHMRMMMQAQRQSGVAERGKDVMPFSLAATTHIFSKNAEGGVQRVVIKSEANPAQVKLIRGHLRQIRSQFLMGDFSGPSHIHGQDMPGLAELKATPPGQIAIDYKDIKSGGQLTYRTSNAVLVAALHQWFDAQLSDHGRDAVEGHHNH